jgi:hypothetical protein
LTARPLTVKAIAWGIGLCARPDQENVKASW